MPFNMRSYRPHGICWTCIISHRVSLIDACVYECVFVCLSVCMCILVCVCVCTGVVLRVIRQHMCLSYETHRRALFSYGLMPHGLRALTEGLIVMQWVGACRHSQWPCLRLPMQNEMSTFPIETHISRLTQMYWKFPSVMVGVLIIFYI